MKFAGKRVLTTGAAGGLGQAAALAFVRGGGQVVALDVQPDKGAQLATAADQIRPGALSYFNQDLTDQPGLIRTLESIVSLSRPIDILINNAGIYPSQPFEGYTIDDFRHIQQINVEAAVICCQVLLPAMRQRQFGRIINVSSITISGGWSNLSAYVASKAALIGLTRAWAREFGCDQITVNALCVGAIPTPAEEIHPDRAAYTRRILESQAIKRRGTPEDVAHAFLYFASEEAGFVTGQSLNVDGGWVMS